MQEFNTELQTISVADLDHVTGGSLLSMGQKAYKWWTKSKKLPSPKELYDEGVSVAGKAAGLIGGIGYGVKKAYDWVTGSGEPAK